MAKPRIETTPPPITTPPTNSTPSPTTTSNGNIPFSIERCYTQVNNGRSSNNLGVIVIVKCKEDEECVEDESSPLPDTVGGLG